MFVIIQSTRSPDQICSRVLKECSVFFFLWFCFACESWIQRADGCVLLIMSLNFFWHLNEWC